MLVGDKGPLSEAQSTKQQFENKERARIETLSDKNLVGEIRSKMRADHLSFALGAAVLTLLHQPVRLGNDPYCLTQPHRPKMGRTRQGKITNQKVAA